MKESQEQLRKLLTDNSEKGEQVRVLNENLRRESEQANHLSKQNSQFRDENVMLKRSNEQAHDGLE